MKSRIIGMAGIPLLALMLGAAAANGDERGHGMMGGGMGMMQGGKGMMSDCPMMGSGRGMGDAGDGPMAMEGGMMQKLDLSEEQRQTLHELHSDHKARSEGHREQMQELKGEMRELMRSERPDPDEVETLHGKLSEHRGHMLAERVRLRNATHDALSEEQVKRMRQMHQRMKKESSDVPETEDDHEQHH